MSFDTDALVSAQSLDALTQAMSRAIASLGYDGFDAYSVKADDLSGYRDPSNFFICDYGKEKVLPYVNNGWFETDPTIQEIAKRVAPFNYIAYLQTAPLSRSVLWQRGIMATMGVKRAWCVPLNSPARLQSTTVYSRDRTHGAEERFQDTQAQVALLSALCIERALALNKIENAVEDASPQVALSARETECLHWAGQGKTNWEIATILEISENTVRFHLKNAFRKLGASSRGSAATQARRAGLLG